MRTRRSARLGHEAWLRGELDRAVELLEAARSRRRGYVDATLPLARALSERNEPDRALALLEEAAAGGNVPIASRVFRAIVLYDHGRLAESRAELGGVPAGNLLASALDALIELRLDPAPSERLSLPPGARWISEVAGRLLAPLETRILGADPDAAIALNHSFFALNAGAGESPIEKAFAAKSFAEVAQLRASGTAEEPKQAAANDIYHAFSLVALGRDADALEVLRRARHANPANADAHFLEGFCHARFGRGREAGWSFVRASRLADFDFDHVLTETAEKAGVTISIGASPRAGVVDNRPTIKKHDAPGSGLQASERVP